MSTLNELLEKPDGSIPGIHLSNLLDNMPVEQRNVTLQSLLKKVRYEGMVELVGTDIEEVLRAAHQGYIGHDQIVDLLYKGRQSVSSCNIMTHTLKEMNYKIISQRVNHYAYYIKAQRCPPPTI